MCRHVTHLLVAVLTFAVGTLASLFFGSILSPSLEKAKTSTVSITKTVAPQPMVETISSRCGCTQSADDEAIETDAVSSSKGPIRGGILNGRALSLPKPPYPAIARAARASGTVAVEIVVNERGCVQSAHAVGGHPLLQSAAAQAARQACFAPTRLSGQPVKVSGMITYNFALQ